MSKHKPKNLQEYRLLEQTGMMYELFPEFTGSYTTDIELPQALATIRKLISAFDEADNNCYWGGGIVEVQQIEWSALDEAIQAARY